MKAFVIDAIRNSVSAETGRSGLEILHAKRANVDEATLGHDSVDEPGNMGIELVCLEDLVRDGVGI